MGQLIKLQDYISRYEIDIYRYPSQYIRLKKQQWNQINTAWENGTLDSLTTIKNNTNEIYEKFQLLNEEKKSMLRPLKQFFQKSRKDEENHKELPSALIIENEDEIDTDDMYSSLGDDTKNIEEVKQKFLDSIFKFQMKWASSTIREKSYIDDRFYNDEGLKYFLQRFPDTYLVMYQPVFLLKHAPIEVEIIMISPTCTWCISLLEGEENSVFLGSKERFWTERTGSNEKKVLSPLIGLNRMEKIVTKVFQLNEVEMPIRKVVLNRNGYFDYPFSPYDVEFIDKRNYEGWFSHLRKLSSPLKHVQLKAAQSLLLYCQTTCVKRVEWNGDGE